MKKYFVFSILMICLAIEATYGQTGINTGNTALPTKTLDINGELRIRNLPPTTAGDVLVADVNGNVVKVGNYVLDNAASFGDIKKGFQPADHQGWYLLNGRTVASLPAVATANATALGFAINLPDAQGKFLKTPTDPTAVGFIGGTNTPILLQANLPSFNFTGSTTGSATTSHSHSGTDNYSQLVNGTNFPSVGTTTSTIAKTRPIYDQDKVTSTSGSHAHTGTVNSNVSPATAFSNTPQYIVANIFIYLGQ